MSRKETVEVELTERQAAILNASVNLPLNFGGKPFDSAHRIVLTHDEIRTLVDAVADRLQSIGFDEAYAVTDEGAVLESVIDMLTGRP